VYDNGVQVMSSNGTQDGDCRWVRFDNWDYHVAFTKGRQLTVKFTRSGSDSIQFYYDNDPYRYGQLIVGQDTYPNRDLACRVYGRTKKVDSKPGWGAIPVLVVGSV